MYSISFKKKLVAKASLPFSILILIKLQCSPLSESLGDFLKSVKRNYFDKQYEDTSWVNVAVPLDAQIPIRNAVRLYLSFFPFSLGILWFLHREFKDKADAKIINAIRAGKVMYEEAGKVFSGIQSTFEHPDLKGANFGILHLIDKNKSCYPSMHVQILGEIYLLFITSTTQFASHPEDYKDLEQALFEHFLKIVETCSLVKQHSIQDLAAGFAALSYINPEFTEELALKFISHIFTSNDYGMAENDRENIRRFMQDKYFKILDDLKASDDYATTFTRNLQAMNSEKISDPCAKIEITSGST